MADTTGAHKQTARGLHFFSILQGARAALKSIDGLRARMWQGFWVNFIVFLALTIAFNVALYIFVMDPLVAYIFGEDSAWHNFGAVLGWLLQFVIAAVVAVIGLRFTIALTALWYEGLVTKIIAHFRDVPQMPFSWSQTVKGIGSALLGAIRDIAIGVVLLAIGFISMVGTPLVLVAEAFLAGKGLVGTYTDTLKSNGLPLDALRKPLKWLPLQVGALPMLLALIPFVGWVLMPIASLYLVIGLTWECEQLQQKTLNSEEPPH